MYKDRFLKRLFTFAVVAMLAFPSILGHLGKLGPMPFGQPAASGIAPTISDARKQHLLHGDRTGGGHLYGTGNPCESEFPQGWSEDDIISTVTTLAANDNLGWHKQKNGKYVAEAEAKGVNIRIVLDSTRTQIVTAYPLNTPRNPCNRTGANDN